MPQIACPKCKTPLQVAASPSDTIVACPRCQTRMRVPASAPPPPAPPISVSVPPAVTASSDWYYVQDRKKFGPLSFASLQELALTGRLAKSDMVLQNGTDKWVPAETVANLFPPARVAVDGSQAGNGTTTAPQPPPLPSPPKESITTAKHVTEALGAMKAGTETLKEVAEKLKGVAEDLKQAHQKFLWIAGFVPVIGGFVGDFLRPLAPFNGILFLLSLLASVALVVLFLKRPKYFGLVTGGACLMLILASIGFGGWWGLGLVFGKGTRGFMGSRIGPVASLQSAVLTIRSEEGVTTETGIKGDELAEQVRRQLETEKDAAKLLHFAFDGYPANVIKAEVIGEPQRRKGTRDRIVIEYNLRIGVDLEQYDNVTRKKLLPILEKVAINKGEVLTRAESIQRPPYRGRLFDSSTNQRLNEGSVDGKETIQFGPSLQRERDPSGQGYGQVWRRGDLDKGADMIVVVNTGRSGSHDRGTWKWFHVPLTPLFDFQNRESAVRIKLFFKDREGHDLNRDQMLLRGRGIPGLCLENANNSSLPAVVVISPYMLDDDTGDYAQTVTALQIMRLTQDELQNLARVTCAVEALEDGSAGKGRSRPRPGK